MLKIAKYYVCVQEFRKDQIGTICYEYVGLKENFKQVGKGGFGKVYAYVQPDIQRKLAVKVEEKVCNCTVILIMGICIYVCGIFIAPIGWMQHRIV